MNGTIDWVRMDRDLKKVVESVSREICESGVSANVILEEKFMRIYVVLACPGELDELRDYSCEEDEIAYLDIIDRLNGRITAVEEVMERHNLRCFERPDPVTIPEGSVDVSIPFSYDPNDYMLEQ